MARYNVIVRVQSGWPPSGSDLYALHRAARKMPGPLRLRSVLFFVDGDSEISLRVHGPLPAAMAIQQVRLALPMLSLRRDAVRRIDVVRVHPLRSHRVVLTSWLPTARDRTSPPPPPWPGRRGSDTLSAG